jgi:hypothetical protein
MFALRCRYTENIVDLGKLLPYIIEQTPDSILYGYSFDEKNMNECAEALCINIFKFQDPRKLCKSSRVKHVRLQRQKLDKQKEKTRSKKVYVFIGDSNRILPTIPYREIILK